MEIFKSRRFYSALLGVIFMALAAFIPELNGQADTLIQAIMVIIGILIGGYTAENTASVLADASVQRAIYRQASATDKTVTTEINL